VFEEQDEGRGRGGPVACAARQFLPLLLAAREKGREEGETSVEVELMNKLIEVSVGADRARQNRAIAPPH
jgi:hypothetical protein